MKNIAILGATGSIGRNTLQVVERLSQRFRVVGLAAGRNIRLLHKQIERFKPEVVSVEGEKDARELKKLCKALPLKIVFGEEGAEEVARFRKNDIIVSAITGIKELRPTLVAVKAGKRVALANKESMVVAGPLIQDEVRNSGSEIIPSDSEHNGIFQCLMKENKENVKRIILTASGGPFFRTPQEEMKNKTLEEALEHPRWKMGQKVTIDSATLMNKGLEVIEARWLFDIPEDRITVHIHPQSIVHSMVEYVDGSVIAQLGIPDMSGPIAFALSYPERLKLDLPTLDLFALHALTFLKPDFAKFPCLELAFAACKAGGTMPAVLNAANEVAVQSFLDRRVPLTGIATVVNQAMQEHVPGPASELEEIVEADCWARRRTAEVIESRW
jgi:1-deoxy-D-xylulose-5-phosphate reductoisomerase